MLRLQQAEGSDATVEFRLAEEVASFIEFASLRLEVTRYTTSTAFRRGRS